MTPVSAVNGFTVLETVAALPVSTWRYLWESEDVRHLGPMAQDWHAAFGFNRDDTTIPVVDGLGVSLVCIQALNRRIDELTAEVGRLGESAEGSPQDGARADTGRPCASFADPPTFDHPAGDTVRFPAGRAISAVAVALAPAAAGPAPRRAPARRS
ncbi:tail fiber domain-containing protein [Kitasatospora sp. NPDC058218]|uniref:tail fiber domain-containing protein n=1 Tax=Kitasatospora sp. NPDC058218 TaxID=3346385 RepID=UPI0036D849E4